MGYAPLIGEPYFGHRSRLYQLDLHRNPEKIAEIIVESYNQGVRAINLVNDDALLEAYDIASNEGCKMDVIATIGKSDVDYINPNYEVAKEVDWEDDIELFSNYHTPIMVMDEFLFDSYDWKLTAQVLETINETQSFSGISTAFPCRTSNSIMENLNLDLFDFLMIPVNKVAYMMDIPSFLKKERTIFRKNILNLNKKVIASRVLAAGIQMPSEAFEFIKNLDYIDLVTIGVASVSEAKEDFSLLKEV